MNSDVGTIKFFFWGRLFYVGIVEFEFLWIGKGIIWESRTSLI